MDANTETKPTGYRSTDSREPIPAGWVEVTRKRLLPDEIVRTSYVGPLVRELDTIVGLEVHGQRQWFAKTAWHVNGHRQYLEGDEK